MVQVKIILSLFLIYSLLSLAQPFGSGVEHGLEVEKKFVYQQVYQVYQVYNVAKADTLREMSTPLKSGETVVTGQLEYAIVHFKNESMAIIRPGSRLLISGEEGRNQDVSIRIDLDLGGLFIKLNENNRSEFEITTRSGVIFTTNALFGALASGFFWVDEGAIEIMAINSGQMVQLRAGMFAQTDQDGLDVTTGQL